MPAPGPKLHSIRRTPHTPPGVFPNPSRSPGSSHRCIRATLSGFRAANDIDVSINLPHLEGRELLEVSTAMGRYPQYQPAACSWAFSLKRTFRAGPRLVGV